VALTLACAAVHASAQEVYPSRPIEMIVPWGPGGGSDQTGRKIAKLLENELKVSLPVVNVPGATGNTGIIKLLAGRNDGYALAVLAADTLYANQIAGTQKWTLNDLTPIAVMIQQPSGFYVAENSRFKTWADVEAEAKTKGVKVGISGFGSPRRRHDRLLQLEGAEADGRPVRESRRALHVADRRPYRPVVFAARQRAQYGRRQADARDHRAQQHACSRVQGRAIVEGARLRHSRCRSSARSWSRPGPIRSASS
jgi:TRAP-type uncharacterized transport system substrate-binding protein